MGPLGRWLVAQWDRASAWAAVAAGAILLIVGWIEVSGTGYPAEQIPYIISGGLGGIFLLGLGATLWLSADLRDEWRKLDRIEQAITAGRKPEESNGRQAVEITAETVAVTADPDQR